MRTNDEVRRVLWFVQSGFSYAQIYRLTGVTAKTIMKWRRDVTVEHRLRTSGCPDECARKNGLDRAAYAYLLGQYLGDGTINHMRRNVYRLSIYSDLRYPNIIDEVTRAISAVMPMNVVGRREHHQPEYPDGGCVELRAYSKHWPCLFPQHGEGLKHLRSIQLSQWQQQIVREHPRLLLRGLIHSDGCRSINRVVNPKTKKMYAYPRYEFSNRSSGIRAIFCEACDLLGIHWTVMNSRSISVARRPDVARMDDFIGPKN